jgi:3D (Asp-Asp-Asp) domain-containing protein
MRRLGAFFALFTILAASGCAANESDGAEGSAGAASDLSAGSGKSFVAKGTGYFPDSSAMEGGFVDRKGVKLTTLQQYLSGAASYASVAMDSNAFPYGQRLRIHELNDKYGRDIVFKVVDSGGAFKGKGTSRIDICTASSKDSLEPTINGTLHIDAISSDAPSIPVSVDTPSSSGSSPDPSADSNASSDPSFDPSLDPTGGGSCSDDGACNAGGDGAGMICVSEQCVPGCHTNAQCPGASSCQGGECL